MVLTSNLKGHIAFTKTLTRALELGYVPSIPTFDTRYDLILDYGNNLLRVQVKYANGVSTNSEGSVRVKLSYETRTRKKYKYQPNEVDALIVYIPKVDKLCYIPPELFINKDALSIRIERSKNNQNKRVILAENYYW